MAGLACLEIYYLSKFEPWSPSAPSLIGLMNTFLRPLFFCEARHAARALSFSDISIAFSRVFRRSLNYDAAVPASYVA
jgi:hypothetical protein